MATLLLAFLLQLPAVETIMSRVAENQTRAEEGRNQWIYQQSVLVRMHRSNGKLAREEASDFLVTPTAQGTEKQRLRFSGKYEQKGQYHEYSAPHHEYKEIDVDADLISDIADDLTNEKRSKDGVANELFPLTPKQQQRYVFHLKGKEDYRGSEVYRVTFTPKPGKDGIWKGEALIDAQEFQPLMVTTSLGQKIPLLVKTLLGTDVHHVGFKVTYKKLGDGVWFPATYGGEFYVRALFLYKRTISLSLNNSEFKKTDVDTKITFEKQ